MSCQAGNGEMRISHVQGFQLGSRCAGPNIASEILHPRSERSDRSGPEATLRKDSNCQIGVFATYVSRHGHAFIDRALYLPKEWTDDPDRLEATYVPTDVGFATKPKLATRMIARAIAASVPFKWVAGDTVYGVGNIEQQLRKAGKGYVLGVSSAHVFHSWGKRPPVAGTAADLARTRPASDWKRLSAGAGTKGPRLHDWCYLELADLEAGQFNAANEGIQ